jgi:hypothetical protein
MLNKFGSKRTATPTQGGRVNIGDSRRRTPTESEQRLAQSILASELNPPPAQPAVHESGPEFVLSAPDILERAPVFKRKYLQSKSRTFSAISNE